MKKKTNKTRKAHRVPELELPPDSVTESKEYKKFISEHNRKLRQLQRELSGENMYAPDC